MRVKQCDACLKTFHHYDGTDKELYSNGLILVNWGKNGKYEKKGYFDLCPSCMKELAYFLSNDGMRAAGQFLKEGDVAQPVLSHSDDISELTSEGTSNE